MSLKFNDLWTLLKHDTLGKIKITQAKHHLNLITYRLIWASSSYVFWFAEDVSKIFRPSVSLWISCFFMCESRIWQNAQNKIIIMNCSIITRRRLSFHRLKRENERMKEDCFHVFIFWFILIGHCASLKAFGLFCHHDS